MQGYARTADPTCIDEMHAALERLWAEVPDVDEMQRIRFATALAEVVTNVVAHGRTPEGGTPTLTVLVTAFPDRLEADLTDNGVELARRGLAPQMCDDELAENGRGLALAREALDELHYDHRDGANHWALVIRR